VTGHNLVYNWRATGGAGWTTRPPIRPRTQGSGHAVAIDDAVASTTPVPPPLRGIEGSSPAETGGGHGQGGNKGRAGGGGEEGADDGALRPVM